MTDEDSTDNAPEPVAYAVWHVSERYPGRVAYSVPFKIKMLRGTGETRDGEEFIPLYGKPTLTAEEREAIENTAAFREYDAKWEEDKHGPACPRTLKAKREAAILRKLLERLE